MVEVLGREAASAVTDLEKTRWYDSPALQRLGLEPQRFLNARSGYYLTRRLSGVPYVLGASLIYKLGLERGVVVRDHIDIMSLALALGNTSVFKLLHTRDDLFITRVIQGYVVPLVPLEKFEELKLALGRRGALESRLKTATAPAALPYSVTAADGAAEGAHAPVQENYAKVQQSQQRRRGRPSKQTQQPQTSLDGLVLEEPDAEPELDGRQVTSAFRQFMNHAARIPLLSKGEEEELLVRVKEGDERALNALVEANYRLVVFIAHRLYRPSTTLDLMDLVQEGITGLYRAAQKYDIEEAFRRGREQRFAFSTYANWWIRQSMHRAIDDTTLTIRLPSRVLQARRGLLKVMDYLTQLNGASPSVEVIAKETGLPKGAVEKILSRGNFSIDSLDREMYEEDSGVSLGDLVADESLSGNVEEAAVSNIDKDSLMATLEQILDPRQLRVVVERFGLGEGGTKTLEAIGIEFGVTRERIRQLEAKALKKLRKSEYLRREFGSLFGEAGPEVGTVADGYAAEPAPPYVPKNVPQEKVQKRRYNSLVAGSESPRTARKPRQPRSSAQNFHRNGSSEREEPLEDLEDVVKKADKGVTGPYGNEFPDAFHQFMEYASSVTLLTKDKEQELLGKVREGDKEALDALLEANYRLVVHFALNLWNSSNHKTDGLELMDLVQEGVIGLRTAALHYRSEEAQARGFERPFAFSTYATWWIKQAMDRTIKNIGRMIRLPVYIIAGSGKLNQAIEALARNGDTPSVEELVEATGMPESTVSKLLAMNEPGTVSLDTVVSGEGEGEGGMFDYFMPDESELGDVEGYVVSEIANEQLKETLIRILTPRELKIISDHYGLGNGNHKTSEEIGKDFGLSGQRIRQIEAEAIERLRRSKEFRLLFSDNGTANLA